EGGLQLVAVGRGKGRARLPTHTIAECPVVFEDLVEDRVVEVQDGCIRWSRSVAGDLARHFVPSGLDGLDVFVRRRGDDALAGATARVRRATGTRRTTRTRSAPGRAFSSGARRPSGCDDSSPG